MSIRRHPALVALSRDHHHTLALARAIRTGAPEGLRGDVPRDTRELAKYVVETWEDQLDPHCRAEEAVLIPAARGHTPQLDAACEAISADHMTMRRIVNALKTAEEDDARALLDQLGSLLDRHARFEERQLFELVQSHLTEDELSTLGDEIERVTSIYQLGPRRALLTRMHAIS